MKCTHYVLIYALFESVRAWKKMHYYRHKCTRKAARHWGGSLRKDPSVKGCSNSRPDHVQEQPNKLPREGHRGEELKSMLLNSPSSSSAVTQCRWSFCRFRYFDRVCLGHVPLYIVIAVGFIFCLSSHFVTPLNICVRQTPWKSKLVVKS